MHPRLNEVNAPYLDFSGRIIGLSIKFGMPIGKMKRSPSRQLSFECTTIDAGIHLSHAAIMSMSERNLGAAQLREMDVELANTCRNILLSRDVTSMGLMFASVGDGTELFSGSLDLKVTEKNRNIFVEMLAQRRLYALSSCASKLMKRGILHVIHSENVAFAAVALARMPPQTFNALIGGRAQNVLLLHIWLVHKLVFAQAALALTGKFLRPSGVLGRLSKTRPRLQEWKKPSSQCFLT